MGAPRFEDLLDRLSESVSTYDREGRLLYINEAGRRHFNRSREQLIGHRPWDLVPSDPDSPFRAALREVLGGAGVAQAVGSYVRGLQRWYECDIYPIPEGALVVARDVTERTVAQEQLAQARRLEAIGRLAGGVAHDFNNVMAVILTSAEAVLARLAPDDPSRESLEDILTAAERAALITRQLLTFGGKQRVAPHLVSMGDRVVAMERVIRRTLGEHIALTIDLDAQARPVRVDPGQIDQVILNLVVNARDAMPAGGSLRVSVARVDVPEAPGGDATIPSGSYVVLTVADTGEGMDEETRARVFEPFFTTKALGRGTGLGLSTVHGIVEQARGHVRVKSAPGAGTTFTVFIPCADPPAHDARVL